jgi:hypothetical protein
MSIQLKTINGDRVSFEAWRVVYHEEGDNRQGTTRVFLEGNHIALLKVPFDQFTDILEGVKKGTMPADMTPEVAAAVPGHPEVEEVTATTVTEASTPAVPVELEEEEEDYSPPVLGSGHPQF